MFYLSYTVPYGAGVSYLVVWPMLCAEDVANYDTNDWMTNVNGTSPYILTENVPASSISYQRKSADQYWGELPEAETVTYKYYSDTTTMYIDFESGNLDAAYGINAQDGERVVAGNCADFVGYNLVSQKDVVRVQLCETTEVLQDPAVREAISLAISQFDLATSVYGSLWLPANSTIASTVQYYVDCGEHEYNVEKAKQVLTDAGYAEGDISLRLVCTIDNQNLATTLQAALAQIGIDLKVETYDLGVLVPMWMQGEGDVLIQQTIGGAFFSDPIIVYANNSPENVMTRIMAFTDPVWAEAYQKASYTTDTAQRAAAYETMQRFLVEGNNLIPICETTELVVFNTNKIASYDVTIPGNPQVYGVKFVG